MKHLIKTILREEVRLLEDSNTKTPNLGTDSEGYVYIDCKKYELQTNQSLLIKTVRVGITVKSASVNKQGMLTLVAKHPLTGKSIESTISKKNFSKVISGAKDNVKEISVWNNPPPPDKSTEFFLVRVSYNPPYDCVGGKCVASPKGEYGCLSECQELCG